MSAEQVRSSARGSGPLFLVGCGRSGTSLLRLMMDAHPDLAVPEESHVIYQVARGCVQGSWPPRPDAAAVRRFVSLLDDHRYLSLWELSKTSLGLRLEALGDSLSYAALFSALFEEYAARQGKPRWGDKTPMHVMYIPLLRKLFPDARFVHLVRDGRDVAASLLTRTWGPTHLFYAGLYWKWLVLAGLAAGRSLGPDVVRVLRHEDLIAEPEQNLREICAWADLEFDDSMLRYYQTDSAHLYAARGDEKTRRVLDPPNPALSYRWKQSMSASDQRSLLRQAGALLHTLGYEVDELGRGQRRELARIEELLSGPIEGSEARSAESFIAPSLARVRCAGLSAQALANFALGRTQPWAQALQRRQLELIGLMG